MRHIMNRHIIVIILVMVMVVEQTAVINIFAQENNITKEMPGISSNNSVTAETPSEPIPIAVEEELEVIEQETVEASISINASQVDLYVLDDNYKEYLTIPSQFKQTFQLKVSGTNEKPKYSVYTGDSVKVSSKGLIEPATSVTYWNGGMGTSWSTGSADERVDIDYNYGTSVIQIQINSDCYYVSVTVHDYGEYYAEKVMEDYVAKNIKVDMSDLEKLEKITAFPAMYSYSAKYSGYESMIICGGGDCWASSSAILRLCDMVGLQAHLRFGANEPGAGTGHRNVAVKIGDLVYVAEAGYEGEAPRSYNVREENTGFYYRVVDGEAKIIQYDGFESNITVPDYIGSYPVTEIGELAFRYGERYSDVPVKSVVLPNTLKTIEKGAFNSCGNLTTITIPASVTTIGDFVFTNCSSLEEIKVEAGNSTFISQDGVLYSADRKVLLSYPAGKAGTYTIPDGVDTIEKYAFYYTSGIRILTLPDSVKNVKEGAFGSSYLQMIYFSGNKPEMEEAIFHSLNVEVFYPIGNTTWNKSELGTYYANKITWNTWNPLAKRLDQCAITLSSYTYTYDGKEKKPKVTVKDGNKTLKQDTDYTVEYLDNEDSGKGAVILKAVNNGNYAGAASIAFTIKKANPTLQFERSNVRCGLVEGTYTNPLTTNTDGKVTYSSNNLQIATVNSEGRVTLKGLGTCIITVIAEEGNNYFAKQISYTLTVANMKKQEITVSKSLNRTYGEKDFKLKVKVKEGAKLKYLSDDEEIVKVSKNGTVSIVGAGTTKIIVKAEATQNYTNAVTEILVTIKPRSITKCQVAFPAVGNISSSIDSKKLLFMDGDKKLEDDDYFCCGSGKTYTSSGLIDMYVIVEGRGNYTGTHTFSIVPIKTPKLKDVTLVSTGTKVTWKEETGALGYYIYRKEGNGTYKKVKVITDSRTTSWTDTTASKNGTTYAYKIKAYTKKNKKNVYTQYSNPGKVYNLKKPVICSLKSTASNKIKIKWSKNTKADGYEIQYSTSKKFKNAKVKVFKGSAKVSKTITGLKGGKTFYVRIRAYKQVKGKKCCSSWSESGKIKIRK